MIKMQNRFLAGAMYLCENFMQVNKMIPLIKYVIVKYKSGESFYNMSRYQWIMGIITEEKSNKIDLIHILMKQNMYLQSLYKHMRTVNKISIL